MLRKRTKAETVDLSNSGITLLSHAPSHTNDHVTELSLNHNELYTLEGIPSYTNLHKLSVQHNHLVDLTNLSCLSRLVHLDLQHNSLTDITAIGSLLCLRWVCLAGNSIQHYAILSGSRQLEHIDLSNNCISQLEDISNLHNLTELLLSGNIITELNRSADFLPTSLTSLSLSDNELSDITHLVQLSCLPNLQRLWLSGNPFLLPCHQLGVDYKPFVFYCCAALKVIDDTVVAEMERVMAANKFTHGVELHRMTQTQILQQLMQQKQQLRTKSPIIQYPSNNNSLLFVTQHSPTSHDVTAVSPTPYNLANGDDIVMVRSPQMEHTAPFMHITNGDAYDFHSLPAEGVNMQQQESHDQSLPQRKMFTTKPTSNLHSTTGVDTVLGKKVTIVQALVRGYLARKHLEPLKIQTRAATTIQTYWRGHVTRSRNPQVIKCHAELDRQRMHRHILQLSSRLNSYQTELTHNAHMMQIQDETIRSLASEVEELQQWRDHMINRQRTKAAMVIQKYWRGYQVRKFTKVTMAAPHKLSTLWSMCQQLKSQVEELQHAMATMATKAEILTMKQNSSTNVECLPAPSHLQMTHYSNTCLLLEWITQEATPTNETVPTVLGYRVYVNGIAEGQVGSNKRRAYLEGLDPSTTYRITVRSVFAEGESVDSNPVIASLSNNLSRDSSMLTTPHSSFPPSPEKSLVTMTIKEEDKVTEDEEQIDHRVNQTSDGVILVENVVNDLVKETSPIKEDTYSAHTSSSSSSGSSVDLNDPTSTGHELRNTFTVTQESNPEEQQPSDRVSPKSDPHNVVSQESSHDSRTQGNSHSALEGIPHDESEGTQGTNATRENPLSVPSDNASPHCNSLESLHSTLTSSSGDSPTTTPTSSHSPTFHQMTKQRRSFFPPILDFSEDKPTDTSEQKVTTSSSKELATQLLSALEKELSNPLLKPTTCT